MDLNLIYLLVFISTGVGLIRNFLVDTKKVVIPKWLDYSMLTIVFILTFIVLYEAYIRIFT